MIIRQSCYRYRLLQVWPQTCNLPSFRISSALDWKCVSQLSRIFVGKLWGWDIRTLRWSLTDQPNLKPMFAENVQSIIWSRRDHFNPTRSIFFDKRFDGFPRMPWHWQLWRSGTFWNNTCYASLTSAGWPKAWPPSVLKWCKVDGSPKGSSSFQIDPETLESRKRTSNSAENIQLTKQLDEHNENGTAVW